MSPSKIGFAFSTKDRTDFTRRSLLSIDTCSGFDLVWVDGSSTAEGKFLPQDVRPQNCHIAEIHQGVTGGPDRAICFGLRRLIALGYDYCGLIENDVVLEPGWLPKLMQLFKLGSRDGLRVGAATAQTINSRVLCRTREYAVIWNMGAAMVLFTRQAASIVLGTYRALSARSLFKFYLKTLGVDLTGAWELLMDKDDRGLGCDWAYALYLYKQGLCSVGTLPSLARTFDIDLESKYRTAYALPGSEPSQRDKDIFERVLHFASRQGWYPTLERRLEYFNDWGRSALAKIPPKGVGRLVHPMLSAQSLGRRVSGFLSAETQHHE